MIFSSTMIFGIVALFQSIYASKKALLTSTGEFLPHIRLSKDLLDKKHYDNRVRPVIDHSRPTTVHYSMSLYQILAINEKQQNVDLNVWVIQKWDDEFLGWNPNQYGRINTTILPFRSIWLPDTYLYNSVVMNREETERYINAVVTTKYWQGKRGAEIKFMYPALYRTNCRLDIRFFPYDQQNCTLIISSWTSSKSDIDYKAEFESVNLDNFIPNEEWVVISFTISRIEQKFVCCPEPWVLLEASLVVRRKPLYYIVNLVVPTSVITLVAVTGFFTPASTSSERREKLSLGIDSLLAMSILMMMVSEQMPTTSDYVPLFGLFYLTIIFIIFTGTIFTALILNVHLQKIHARPVPPFIAYLFFHKAAPFLAVRAPTTLQELWSDTGVSIGKVPKKKTSSTMSSFELKGESRDRKSEKRNNSKEPCLLPSEDGNKVKPKEASDGSKTDLKSRVNFEDSSCERSPRPSSALQNACARNNWRMLARKASLKTVDGTEPSSTGNEPRLSILALSQSLATPTAIDATTAFDLKLRRRYALEWEFLATVLDRVLLILYSLVVFSVTALMMLIGEAMHISYSLSHPRVD